MVQRDEIRIPENEILGRDLAGINGGRDFRLGRALAGINGGRDFTNWGKDRKEMRIRFGINGG